MSESIDRRDYGILEQKVSQLTDDVQSLKKTVESMRDMMQQARGGWKTLMWVGGTAAAVGTGIGWVLQHLSMK